MIKIFKFLKLKKINFENRKSEIIALIFITFFFIMMYQPATVTTIEEYDSYVANSVLNLNQASDKYGITLTGIKFSLEGYAFYIAYEERNSEYDFLMINDYQVLKEEIINLRTVDLNLRYSILNVTITQALEIQSDNGTVTVVNQKVDSFQRNYTLSPEGYSWAGFQYKLRPTDRGREIVTVVMQTGNRTKVSWVFFHETRDENLLADLQTQSERLYESLYYSVISISIFTIASWLGSQIAKKAKKVSGIPDGVSYFFVAFISSSWTIAIEVFQSYRYVLIGFVSAVILFGLIFGMKNQDSQFDVIKIHRFDDKTSEHNFESFEIYKAVVGEKGLVDCVLLDESNTNHPFLESIRRFLGLHRVLVLDIKKGETANEKFSEKKRFKVQKGRFLDVDEVGKMSRSYEIKVTPEMLKYSRWIFDKRRKVQNLEELYKQEMQRNNEMLSKMRSSFKTQLAMTLEAVFETMGEEYYLTAKDSISDEILKHAGLTREDLEKEVKTPKSKRKRWVDKLKFWKDEE